MWHAEKGLKFSTISRRQTRKVKPDAIALVGVGTQGSLMKGFHILISPSVEHYGCAVGLLGQAGQIDKAKEIEQGLPTAPMDSF